MPRAASLLVVMSVVLSGVMSAAVAATMPPRGAPAVAALVPVVSSDAHKGIGGRYGVYKGLNKGLNLGPSVQPGVPRNDARKQPYPYRYYNDTSRGNYGCHRYGQRAIDTDNKNWWLRYKACTEVGNGQGRPGMIGK